MSPASTEATTTVDVVPGGGESDLDVVGAAASTRELLDTVRRVDVEPGACPYGPTATFSTLLPPALGVTTGMRAGSVDDDGQVFFGEPAILYCPIRAADAGIDVAEIDEVRVDVAAEVADVAAYVEQNFASVDADDLVPGPSLFGGEAVSVCHSEGCTAAWQGGELFVAVTLIDGDAVTSTADDASAFLGAVVPLVVERLVELAERRTELASIAMARFGTVFAEQDWLGWDALVLSGDLEVLSEWLDNEITLGTVTPEQADELRALLADLPGDSQFTD